MNKIQKMAKLHFALQIHSVVLGYLEEAVKRTYLWSPFYNCLLHIMVWSWGLVSEKNDNSYNVYYRLLNLAIYFKEQFYHAVQNRIVVWRYRLHNYSNRQHPLCANSLKNDNKNVQSAAREVLHSRISKTVVQKFWLTNFLN